MIMLYGASIISEQALGFTPLSSTKGSKNFITLSSVATTDKIVNDSPPEEITASAPRKSPSDSYDVVVVGSGIGGLSCAAMLSYYGYSVAVFESHYAAGGAAHGYKMRHKDIGDFYFDTGPSFFSGLNPNLPAKSSNPLRTILDVIEEPIECIPYTTFGLKFPEGDFIHTPSFGRIGGTIDKIDGEEGLKVWDKLMKNMEPLAAAVDALPTAALRGDIGTAATAAPK